MSSTSSFVSSCSPRSESESMRCSPSTANLRGLELKLSRVAESSRERCEVERFSWSRGKEREQGASTFHHPPSAPFSPFYSPSPLARRMSNQDDESRGRLLDSFTAPKVSLRHHPHRPPILSPPSHVPPPPPELKLTFERAYPDSLLLPRSP